MTNVADFEVKHAERAGKAAYDKRLEAMEIAWREWRNSVVEAMAARLRVAKTKHDDELELLVLELEHIKIVRNAMRWELGCDPDEDDDAS
jgi:hypothetical protein